MICPACSMPRGAKDTECKECGVIFAHYRRGREKEAPASYATDLSHIPQLPANYRSRLAREWDEYRLQHPERVTIKRDQKLKPILQWQAGETFAAFRKRMQEHVAARSKNSDQI